MQPYEKRLSKMTFEELMGEIGSPQPGSPADRFIQALLQMRIAEMQQSTASQALRWAKLSSVSTAVATVIAVVAVLISILH